MAIQFQCPYCSATIKVPDSASGKTGQCPKCQAKLQVPELAIPPRRPAVPELPPLEVPPAAPQANLSANQLLGDRSTVFVLPPAGDAPPASGAAAPSPAGSTASANPQQAREEYEQGQAWLKKPFVPGAGWPAADRAVKHFQRAAELDPRNADYATRAGVACQHSIDRFLDSWGQGPLTAIAAFHAPTSLGQQIDKAERMFRPSGLSDENRTLLVDRANEGLSWFEQALKIDPDDAVARCHRAELLRNVGAFSAALTDAKAVLSSPLVPSQTRESAQAVADFVLGEDSPLRKYLTRSQAQSLDCPPGIRLPKPVSPLRTETPAAAAPPVDAERQFVINTGESGPVIAPIGSLDPTQAEMPLISAPSVGAASPSVAARLKRRQTGNWKGAVVPILLGVILVGAGLGYMYFNRVTFTGPLTGDGLGSQTLRKTLYRNEFGLPDDRIDPMLTAFREEPETLRTQLRTMVLSASAAGLEVALRAGEGGRLVRVDLRAHPDLAAFCKEHAEQLESPLASLRAQTLKQFASDFEASRSAGMKQGNLGDYLDTLGGDLLVNGLGYHVAALVEDKEYPCIFEDQSGAVYFLVPEAASAFDVIERTFAGQPSIFTTDFRFNVSIQAAAVQAPASTPDPVPAAAPPTDSSPADDDATPGKMEESGEPGGDLPANFFGGTN